MPVTWPESSERDTCLGTERRAIGAAILILLLSSCSREYSQTEFLLGTACTIRAWGGGNTALEAAFDRIRDIEADMSRTMPGSDVNSITPEGTPVSPETCAVVRRGLEFGRTSGGLFDITIGPLVDAWGFGSDNPGIPAAPDIEAALALVDYRRVEVLADCTIHTGPGQQIDLGGIAKGYAADEAARVLRESGVRRAIINLGGNVLTLGSKPDGSRWKIGIQNPFRPTGATVGILEVEEGAVVTSGIYERFFEEAGKRYHHILNPRTGYPENGELAGVSVSVPTALDADALSTTLFLLGIEKGCRLLETFPDSGAVFITRNREIVTCGTASEHFRLTRDDFVIRERL